MPVVPPKPRYKVENRETSTRFIIPSRKNWRAIMFSIVILFPWTSVEFGFLKIFIKAVQGTVSGIESFWGSLTSLGLGWAMLLAWLFLWTLAGSFALDPLLWNLVGKEVIDVGPTSLIIAQKIFFYFRPKEYDANYIKANTLSVVAFCDVQLFLGAKLRNHRL
jgi:hypothetical protein